MSEIGQWLAAERVYSGRIAHKVVNGKPWCFLPGQRCGIVFVGPMQKGDRKCKVCAGFAARQIRKQVLAAIPKRGHHVPCDDHLAKWIGARYEQLCEEATAKGKRIVPEQYLARYLGITVATLDLIFKGEPITTRSHDSIRETLARRKIP